MFEMIVIVALATLFALPSALAQNCSVELVNGTNPQEYCVFTYYAQAAPATHYAWDPGSGRLSLRRAGLWQIRYQIGSTCFGGSVADVRGVIVQSDGVQQSLMSVTIQGRNVTDTISLDSAATSGPRTLRIELADGGSVNALINAQTYDLNAISVVYNVNAGIRIKSIPAAATFNVLGNISGTGGYIQVADQLAGTLNISGDVLDNTGIGSLIEGIQVYHLNGGTMFCNNLRGSRQEDRAC